MKLTTAIVALMLASATAVPAFAAPSASHEVVHQEQTHRHGHQAYAAAPRPSGWGHCVSGLDTGAASAFPAWDVCGTN